MYITGVEAKKAVVKVKGSEGKTTPESSTSRVNNSLHCVYMYIRIWCIHIYMYNVHWYM